MSSVLRSARCVNYLKIDVMNRRIPLESVRNITIPTCRPMPLHSLNRFLSNASLEVNSRPLDRYIRRLDAEVRKTGRVSLKELSEIIDEMRSNRKGTSISHSLMVIRCCGGLIPDELPETRTRLVSEVWDTLEKQGVTMDVSHYNALLAVYLENEHHFSPTEFLESLEKKGIEPNRVTFQRLIAAFCQTGDIDGATRILEFMKEKQMPINENVFNSLIVGHSQANDMESAMGILSVMQQANIVPTGETFTCLLSGYAKRGNAEGLQEVLTLVENQGEELSDKQLLEVIYNLVISGHLNMADIVTRKLKRHLGYNQDAKNTILRLLIQNEIQGALKVLRTMTPIFNEEEEQYPLGTFFIKNLVKSKKPFKMIVSVCDELERTKENVFATLYAIEASHQCQNKELSLQLLAHLARRETLCQHYYWPIIVQFGKDGNTQGVIDTLKQMSVDMQQPVTNETLREYAVEYLGDNGEQVIRNLRQAGVTVASAASAVVAYNLSSGDMKSAAKTAVTVRANYNQGALKRNLVQAYKTKGDADSLVNIVRAMKASDSEISEDGRDVEDPASSVLLSVAAAIRTNKGQALLDILKGYEENTIGISSSTAESLQELLSGDALTPEISTLLSRLTSPEILSKSSEKSLPRSLAYNKEAAVLLQDISEVESKQEDSTELKKKLLLLCCHNWDLDKSVELQQELKNKGVELSPNHVAALMELFVYHDKQEESIQQYEELKNKFPNFKIDEHSIVRLAYILIRNEKYDDAVKLFETNKLDTTVDQKYFVYNSNCWKLLNHISEKGDAVNVDKVFDAMKNNNYIVPTNVLLGPLIKARLLNKDIKGALDKFEECTSVYRATPWKNEIACKLIQEEDAASLQRLTDLSTQVHGEVNSLYDLVLSFIECGRVRQARKILETPGLRMRHERLNSASERYKNDGKMDYLENLVLATKDLPHIDRADICFNLLGVYSNNNEVDKAEALWTQMQEEDVQPSDPFLAKLAALLRKNNRPVPFSEPEIDLSIEEPSRRTNRIFRVPQENTKVKSFRRALFQKDIDKALELKESIREGDLSLTDRGTLLIQLVNSGRLGEATKLLVSWLEKGIRPSIRSLNFIINSVAKAGDTTTLSSIGLLLDEDLKRLTSFSNRFTHCMVEAGMGNKVLEQMEADIDKASTPEEIEQVRIAFPRGGVYSLFDKGSEFIETFKQIAKKYKEKGLLEPTNALWVHHILLNEKGKAAEYWNDLKSEERLIFQPILKKACSQRDVPLAEELLDICKEGNLPQVSLAAIHSAILDIHLFLEKFDECEKRLDKLAENFPVELLSINTLKRIKKSMESLGRPFKYTIPEKRRRERITSSSSSSDSDTEEVKK